MDITLKKYHWSGQCNFRRLPNWTYLALQLCRPDNFRNAAEIIRYSRQIGQKGSTGSIPCISKHQKKKWCHLLFGFLLSLSSFVVSLHVAALQYFCYSWNYGKVTLKIDYFQYQKTHFLDPNMPKTCDLILEPRFLPLCRFPLAEWESRFDCCFYCSFLTWPLAQVRHSLVRCIINDVFFQN